MKDRARPRPAPPRAPSPEAAAGSAAAEDDPGRARTPPSAVPIVGVGASAGGLEAFRLLVAALRVDTGMAYVLVQHLDPRHQSILAELLAKASRVPVSEVEVDTAVEPDHVYVTPARQDVTIQGGMLTLVPRTSTHGQHTPIDVFLRTLAEARGSRAIGVILSGTGSDGTLGVKAIKAGGGVAFAQDPGTAAYDGMPRSAIATGCVDFVLPPEQIARELSRLGPPPRVITPRREERADEARAARLGARAELGREADRILLARAPAGVIVDGKDHIVEFRGRTDPYLAHPQGRASLDLFKMARKGLLLDLREAIREARRKDVPLRREGVLLRHRGQIRRLDLEVAPLMGSPEVERALLVTFEARPEARMERAGAAGRHPRAALGASESSTLKQELAEATRHLQAVVQEHEAASEELQASNEQVLSANEELQSINEELETAKEELQSTNEELTTLNQEMRDGNLQLGRALDYANGIVETVRNPLLILDAGLRVERANRAFYDFFRDAPQETVGRLLYDLGQGQWDIPALRRALEEVLPKDARFADFEIEHDFPRIGRRILLVNARKLHHDSGEESILLALEDTTQAKNAERDRETLLAMEQAARRRAEEADRIKDEFVATLSHELGGPLNAMVGWVHILRDRGIDEATRERGRAAIERGVQAQARLIEGLLDYSRMALPIPPRLPLLTDAVQADVPIESAAPEKPGRELDHTMLEGVRLLVVEDDADSREMLVTAFEQCGAQVSVAASSSEAREALQRSTPDAIVCDIALPGEDGHELIRKVRAGEAERGGRIPALALTAYAGPEARQKALAAGFDAHVPKPAAPAELAAKVALLAGARGGR
ncbi:MAG TPA: chemotaxis protein CheB [Vicinamibacteria bacterium]|nr:chemotaxis protein CheB [Vicinamibacteria bacterium]